MVIKLRFKKLRLWMAYPIFLAYPFVARITDISYIAGTCLVFLGLGVRFWASGHISKSRRLATSGPYAYTRNPLYLGNFIVGLGIVAISNNVWLILYYLAAFPVLYIGTIREEEISLEEKFEGAYRIYLACVPSFFPFFKKYGKAENKPFDLGQSFRNGEFIRLSGFIVLLIFIYLMRSLGSDGELLSKRNMWAFFLFIVFLSVLWFNIIIRRKDERRRQV